jgi:lipoprotein-releasing system ATP-binding protein
MSIVLQAKGISKNFHDPVTIQVLKDVSFEINRGEFVSVIGKSGCGKSTLLYILSTMDTDYEGDLFIDGVAMRNKKEGELALVRNEKIGFVFQFHYLLNEFSVLRNVMLPGLKLGKYTEQEVEHRAMEKLRVLGIDNEAHKMANQLSGGQKQRISIARALAKPNELLLFDDCLSAVDANTEFQIAENLNEYLKERTAIIITHRILPTFKFDKIIVLEDGMILEEGIHEELVRKGGYYADMLSAQQD